MRKSILFITGLLCAFQAFAFEKNLLVKETFNTDSITKLNFNLTYEDVVIQKVYSDEITMEIYSNYKKKLPSYEVNNKALELKSTSSHIFNYDLCKIFLYIPEDYKMQEVLINTTSGDIQINVLNAENMLFMSEPNEPEYK